MTSHADQDPEVSRLVEQALTQTSVRPVSLGSLDQQILAQLLGSLPSRHHLDGAASESYPAMLVFRQPRPGTESDSPRCFLWSYPGTFGNGLDVTMFFPKAGKSRVLVSGNPDFLNTLVCGRFYAVVADGASPRCAFEVDTTGFSPTGEFLRMVRENLSHGIALDDPQAYYWEVLWRSRANWEPYFSVREHLSLGWVGSYLQTVSDLGKALEALRSADSLSSLPVDELSPILRDLLEHVKSEPRDITGLVGRIRLEIERGRFWELMHALVGLPTSRVEWHLFREVLGSAVRAGAEFSRLTQCGSAVPWVDSTGGLNTIQLQPERFRDPAKAAWEYWASLQAQTRLVSFTMPLGHLIDPDDVPISPLREGIGWREFLGAEDVEEATAATAALLSEAVSEKQWTIPPRALVDLEIGPFRYLEMSEFEPDVFFTLRTARDEFRIVSVDPARGTWNARFTVLREGQESVEQALREGEDSSERRARVEAGVCLLLAALVRDFWVVEERESVIGHRLDRRRPGKRMLEEGDEHRVVYLPRIRYRRVVPDVRRCNEWLGLRERRAHWVSAYLRRAREASPEQQALAVRFGFHVPEGYTFVRPHERGRLRREVTYRSRSALQSLYVIDARPTGTRVGSGWFQFERDVRTLMKSLGFDVEHVSTSRTGDRGIDVFATKGEDLDRVSWIVQCKCWSPKHKVGPNVVRELVGTLSRYPQGTRGMIVTASKFTSGAAEEAQRSGVRLMDGTEFYRLLGTARDQSLGY